MNAKKDSCSISIKMLLKDAKSLATFLNLSDGYVRGVYIHFDAIRNESMATETKKSLLLARRVQEIIENSIKEREDEHDNK